MFKRPSPLALLSYEEEEEEAINLTPLIDVVFVVLILFILIAPLIEMERIQLAPARANKKEHLPFHKQEGAELHVRSDNSLWLNGRPLKREELLAELKRVRAEGGGTTLQLFHDKKAPFGTYQMIKNSAEMAGFERLDLILKSE